MNDEAMRKEFEAWAHGNLYDKERWGKTYKDIETRCAWEAWKASREVFFTHTPPMAFLITSGNKTVLTTSLAEAHEIADNYDGKIKCLYAPPAN